MGSTPAPGVVFRASRKTSRAPAAAKPGGGSVAPAAGRAAHPATPEAGVLPNANQPANGGFMGGGAHKIPPTIGVTTARLIW